MDEASLEVRNTCGVALLTRWVEDGAQPETVTELSVCA